MAWLVRLPWCLHLKTLLLRHIAHAGRKLLSQFGRYLAVAGARVHARARARARAQAWAPPPRARWPPAARPGFGGCSARSPGPSRDPSSSWTTFNGTPRIVRWLAKDNGGPRGMRMGSSFEILCDVSAGGIVAQHSGPAFLGPCMRISQPVGRSRSDDDPSAHVDIGSGITIIDFIRSQSGGEGVGG